MRSVLAAVITFTVLALTMQPTSATFPGGNGKLAYTDYLESQIHVIDPDGSAECS
jgi:hypothetical protein